MHLRAALTLAGLNRGLIAKHLHAVVRVIQTKPAGDLVSETIKLGECPVNRQQSQVADTERSYLRSVVMAIDNEMSHFDQGGTSEPHVTTDRLKKNWKE
jgi:hypothetical protein